MFFLRKGLPFILIILYLIPVIAVFFTAFRSDDDFWLTGNVFRVISQRDYSTFFDGIRYTGSYAFGFLFSLSVSLVSFFLALKMRHYSLYSGRIWLFVFILSLLPAFIYLPIISAVQFSFSLFFFINTARYLLLSVLLLEKTRFPSDIIFMIIFSASFSEFALSHYQAGGYFYSYINPELSMMPQKQYYSSVLFPLAIIISTIILWAVIRKTITFLFKRYGHLVNAK